MLLSSSVLARSFDAKELNGCVDLIKDRVMNTKVHARDFKFALETRHDGFINFFVFHTENGVQKLDLHWMQTKPCVSSITVSMNLFEKKDVGHLSEITCGQDLLFNHPKTLLAGHKNLGQIDILVTVYEDQSGDLKTGISPVQKGPYGSCSLGGEAELDVFGAEQATKVVCNKRAPMPCRLRKKGL